MNTIKVKKLHEDAMQPYYASEGDAGMDLATLYDLNLIPGVVTIARTGIAFEIPYGYVGLVHPRSGLAARHGITVVNAPGTIDAGYRGEIQIILTNLSRNPMRLDAKSRVAQIVFQKVEYPKVELVEELSDSVRGEGGFGSTGS